MLIESKQKQLRRIYQQEQRKECLNKLKEKHQTISMLEMKSGIIRTSEKTDPL